MPTQWRADFSPCCSQSVLCLMQSRSRPMTVHIACVRCRRAAEVADEALASDIICPVCDAAMPNLLWVDGDVISDLANVRIAPSVLEFIPESMMREDCAFPVA